MFGLPAVFTDLAAQNQSLSILLLPPETNVRNIRHEDLDGDGIPTSDTLELGDECLLSEERIEDGRLGFAVLELLNETPQDRDVSSLHPCPPEMRYGS
jgi:hypothetical protein